MSSVRKVKSAAEALASRYVAQPWFRRVEVTPAALVLHVGRGCEFTNHRAVDGHPVVVKVEGERAP